MSKARRYSFPIFCFLIVLALTAFAIVLFQALQRPSACRLEPQIQLVQLEPVEDGGHIVYQQTLPAYSWSQPVCAITAKRVSFSVELDGRLLYAYNPDNFDHGGIAHWISLPETGLSGSVLTVTSTSNHLSVLVGNHNDLLLYYRSANAPALFFSGLFLVLGVAIGLLSLGTRFLLGHRRPWTLRYLSILVLLMGLWVSMDTGALQIFTGRGAVMYVLAQYAFMALPFFLLQFFRSLMTEDSPLLGLLSRLHLLDLCVSGVLQALDVARLYETLPLTHVLMIVTLLSLLWFLLSRLNSEFRWEARLMLVGFVLLGLSSGVGFLDYYLLEQNRYTLWLSIGMLLFVLSLLAVAICYVYREMVKSSRLQYYQKLANTDLMTRLQSRTAFEDRTRQSPNLEGVCACLVMDINNLKQTNDTMGHLAGDELICDAAECVLSVFESLGDCYRMGGDEFLVLLENTSDSQLQSALAGLELSISRKNLTRPFPLSMAVGHVMGCGASIEQMLHDADAHMYQTKRQMKSRTTVNVS